VGLSSTLGQTWNDDLVAQLRSLWATGLPRSQIAAQLGLTAGMVAGKRHSLGLPPRTGEARLAAEAANGRRSARLCGFVGRTLNPKFELEAPAAPLAGSTPRPWEQRNFGECAFPVAGWGAETLSCCLPTLEVGPYCEGHRAIVAGRPWPPVEPCGLSGGLNLASLDLPPQDGP
jgi:GcrA cell cycle regulator